MYNSTEASKLACDQGIPNQVGAVIEFCTSNINNNNPFNKILNGSEVETSKPILREFVTLF